MPPSTNRPSSKSGARPKAVLYCPECGHASAVDGDWHVEQVAPSKTRTGEGRKRSNAMGRERVTYICPDCGRTITTRPARLVSA